MNETAQNRLKRMTLRAMRRGTKEMDLVLGPFARARLAGMDQQALDLFDRLLEENDNDLWIWVTRPETVPAPYRELLARIRAHAGLTA